MPISLILTPLDHFQINLTFAVTPNLILEPCHMVHSGWFGLSTARMSENLNYENRFYW